MIETALTGLVRATYAYAALCILGGMPPTFVPRNRDAPAPYLLLIGDDGRALRREVLPFVAETVEITGEVARRGDRWLLFADPAIIRHSP